jgi:2-methylcitrate dehydratase PrpD
MFGTMCKSFHPGRAAQNGLTAAHLAKEGFTSSNRVLEAPRGFAHVMSVHRNFAEITENLGKSYEIALNTYKPFACGIVIHPSIDGCAQIRNESGVKAEDIVSIALKVHPLVLELTGKKTPQTGLEGKFSVYHSAAVAIIHGRAGEEEYSDAMVRDPRVIALRDKVTAAADPSIHEDAAHITVTLTGGKVIEKPVAHAIGSLKRPMSDADLEAKFHHLVDPVAGKTQAAELIRLARGIETLADAGAIARAGAVQPRAAAVG